MMTHVPTGGPAGDLETLLRTELGAVADAVAADGRPAPTTSLLARGRTARRRRRAVLTSTAALATAAVLAVGFGVVRPGVRADGPAVPLPRPPDVKAWISSLPVDAVPPVPQTSEGVAVWAGRETQLPQVAGLGRYAYGYGTTDRGLLLGWVTDDTTDRPPIRLGWLKDGRFTPVETLATGDAAGSIGVNGAVSKDGTQYAYSGGSTTAPKGNALVVRRVSDDSAVARVALPTGSVFLGWFGGRPLVAAQDGSQARLLTGSALQSLAQDLPQTPDGSTNLPVTAVREDLLEYSVPAFVGCPTIQGDVATVELGVLRLVRGDLVPGPMLGCFVPGSDPVSPDGKLFVRGGDELTIRSVATGEPIHALGPELPPGATVTAWEPDGKHVRVSVSLDPPGGAAGTGQSEYRRIVRCSVADGTCTRNV